MKLKHFILPVLCAVAALSQTSRAALQAALPEFKSKQALQAQAASRQVNNEEASGSIFYTGKPFEAGRDGYLFKYRSYNSELNRWSSIDPSGFPDGANNQAYAPSPVWQFDPNGLAKMTSYTGTLNWYDGNPRPETFTENFNDYYSDVKWGPTDFSGFSSAFSSAADGDRITLRRTYNFGDAYAIGRDNFVLDGTVSTSSGTKVFTGAITMDNDTFDFNPDPSRTWYNNALTWLLANTAFNPALGGEAFDLTFSGSKAVTYE